MRSMNVARIERRLGFIGMRSMNEAKLGMRKRITLPRVIQREDYENRKKRLAPLPTAYYKTSTESYGVSFCSLSEYNLRHRGDF